MSPGRDRPEEAGAPLVLRPASARTIPVLVWALCGYLLADALVRGAWDVALGGLPWLALGSVVVHALLWRPRLEIHRDRVVVVNPLREYELPFEELDDVRVGPALSVLWRGRRIPVWNGPGLGRRRPGSRGTPAGHPLSRAWHSHLDHRAAEPAGRAAPSGRTRVHAGEWVLVAVLAAVCAAGAAG
jgi:hypothetical protein